MTTAMKTEHLLIAACIAGPLPCTAQNENAVWLFDETVGLDFMTDPPTVLHGPSGFGGDGVAVISDAEGQLVLSADEIQIRNAQYQVLVNGNNLNSDWNQNRKSMFLPWPGHPGQYYLIQTRAWNPNYPDARAVYHRIDVNGSGGIGEVVERDIILSDSAAQYMTAVLDAEGTGIWLILHHTYRPVFMAYHLDANGLSNTPVLSEAGPLIEAWGYQGLGILRPSPDGDRLYMSKCYQICTTDTWLHLMDFDRATGEISAFVTFDDDGGSTGLEVSASGQYLYNVTYACDFDLGIATRLWQYDVSSGDSATIRDSRILVYEAPIVTPELGCYGRQGNLALSIDGRIYCGKNRGSHLAVINQPDLQAPACAYVHDGIWLEGDTSWLWLPNQMREYPVAQHTMIRDEAARALASMPVRPVSAGQGCWITLPDVGIQHVALLDGLGRCVRDMPRPMGQRELHLDRLALASGLYSLVAKDRLGRTVATGRVVFE